MLRQRLLSEGAGNVARAQEAQQQAEMADWQQDGLDNVIRSRGPQDTMREARRIAVYQDIKLLWNSNWVGKRQAKRVVPQAVNRHYLKTDRTAQGRCPQHGGRVESTFPGHVIGPPPMSLLP